MTVAVRRRRGAKWAPTGTGAQLLVVGVAFALRAPNLTTHELYRDDAWPALATRVGLGTALRLGVTVPGFEMLLRLWLSISRSTLWAQLPVLTASLATVVVTYHLARRLGANAIGAVVAAAVLALSPVAVLYATRVKQYAFDALHALVLIALALWVRDDPGSARRWAVLLAVAVGAVAFSASVLPVALVAMAFAVDAARRRGDARRLASGAAALYALFVVGWSVAVVRSVPRPLHDSWDENYVHLSSPWRIVADTWHVLDQFAAGIFYRHGPTGPLLLVALAVAIGIAHRDVALLLLGPVAVALALAALQRVPLGGGRIDMYLYPGVALATGLAVERAVALAPVLAGRPAAVHGALLVAVVVFAATAGVRQTRATRYPSADVHALDVAVRAVRSPGDGIVVSQFSRYPYALYASTPAQLLFSPNYSTGFTVVSRERDVFIMPAEYYEGGYDPDAVVRFAAGRQRVWYIATDSPPFDTPPEIQRNENVPEARLFDAGFHLADRLTRRGAHADLLVLP